MLPRPRLSLIVPTWRVEQLRRFLDSVRATAVRPDTIEVVLVVDADDPASIAFRHPIPNLRHVVVAPGLTMGSLNQAGYESSTGDNLMLLNDDVVVRTAGWDVQLLACLRRFRDGIVLLHVNDTVFRDRLCIFPLVSRTFCELAGGICPREYQRYRIDDHIEDVFNLLGVLGKRRIIYFPDIVFQHLNTVAHPHGEQVYASDPTILALDAPRFEALFPERKELALRLLAHMEGALSSDDETVLRRRLEGVTDSFRLRVPGRQRFGSAPWRPRELVAWATRLPRRVREVVRRRGCYGLTQVVMRWLLGGSR
jgi:hypothetical protein